MWISPGSRVATGARLAAAASILAFAAQFAPLAARAQTVSDESAAQGAPAPQGQTRRINMGVGKSVIVDLPRDATEIFVADPKVANAIVRSARKLYVLATGAGQTSIFAMDPQGKPIITIEINIGRDVGELSNILKTAMPGTEVVPRTVNDTIILTGMVNTAAEAQMAVDIAKGFAASFGGGGGGAAAGGGGGAGGDGKVVNSLTIRGRDQVMLKVTIAEVRRNIAKQLGITGIIARGGWGSINIPNAFGINSNLGGATANVGNYLNMLPSATNPAAGLSAQLQAYETNGVGRILAEPTVTAISGENAKFTAGGQVPIPQPPSCTGGVCTTGGIQYKDVGVTLNFTPVVLAEGRILLRIATEVSEIDPSLSVTIQGGSQPGFRTRKNETSVELPSGGSIVSAGLIETLSSQAINGLPGLMNLPILGTLFRSRDFQKQETELVIMVTPYIAKPSAPAQIARPTDGFEDPTDPQAVLLGRVNRVYSTTDNPQLLHTYKSPAAFIAD